VTRGALGVVKKAPELPPDTPHFTYGGGKSLQFVTTRKRGKKKMYKHETLNSKRKEKKGKKDNRSVTHSRCQPRLSRLRSKTSVPVKGSRKTKGAYQTGEGAMEIDFTTICGA